LNSLHQIPFPSLTVTLSLKLVAKGDPLETSVGGLDGSFQGLLINKMEQILLSAADVAPDDLLQLLFQPLGESTGYIPSISITSHRDTSEDPQLPRKPDSAPKKRGRKTKVAPVVDQTPPVNEPNQKRNASIHARLQIEQDLDKKRKRDPSQEMQDVPLSSFLAAGPRLHAPEPPVKLRESLYALDKLS